MPRLRLEKLWVPLLGFCRILDDRCGENLCCHEMSMRWMQEGQRAVRVSEWASHQVREFSTGPGGWSPTLLQVRRSPEPGTVTALQSISPPSSCHLSTEPLLHPSGRS